MSFQYKTIRLDDYFNAKEGVFENVEAVDPPNALSLGLPGGRSLKIEPDFRTLAVLARTGEGSGSTIINEGIAPNGNRASGIWSTEPDGSIYLKKPRIIFSHHQSMIGVESPDDTPDVNVSGAVSIRNPTEGALISKKGLVKFKVTAAGQLRLVKTYYKAPGSKSAGSTRSVSMTTIGHLFDDGLWHTAGFTIKGNTWTILFDGQPLKEKSFDLKNTSDPGQKLYVGTSGYNDDHYNGDMDMIVYMGSGGAISFFNKLTPSSGEWTSPIVDLGDSYVFDSLTNTGYISADHSASLEIRISDTPDFFHVQTARVDLSREFVPPDAFQGRRLYPREWSEGRYAQFYVSLGQGRSNFSPNISNLEVRFRKR